MTQLMGSEDVRAICGELAEAVKFHTDDVPPWFFQYSNASVVKLDMAYFQAGSSSDFYVITGMVEANRPHDVWVVYMEDAELNIRYTLCQILEDEEPLLWTVNHERGFG